MDLVERGVAMRWGRQLIEIAMIIRYASAPSGAGKTHQIVVRACELAREHKRVLLLQPTKDLIDRTVRDELLARANPPPHHVFHGDTVSGRSVAGELTRYFRDAEDAGQIVFATHQVLPYIPYIANQRDWHVLVDEEIQVLRYRSHQIPKTHPLITDHIDLRPHNSIYSRVMVRNRCFLEEYAKNKDQDEILEILSDTIRTLINPNWTTYVNTAQYERLRRGEVKRLAFHSLLNSTIFDDFASVFMAAANFEDTSLYQLWRQTEGFEADQAFSESLRFRSHGHGHRITIYYATEDPWSRKRLEAIAGPHDQRNLRDRLIQATQELLGDAEFLWQANKSLRETPFGANAIRLSNRPHGLNRYSNVNNIAFLSALNPPSDHFRFLETQELSGSDVRLAIYFQAAYQAVMRTSIREPNNREPKRIVVPDRGLAEYLHDLFRGARIERLNIGIEMIAARTPGRKRKHSSNRERVAHQRETAKEKRIQLLNDLFAQQNRQDSSETCWDNNGQRLRAEMSIDSLTHLSTQPPTKQNNSIPDLTQQNTEILTSTQQEDEILVGDFKDTSCAGTFYASKYSGTPICYLCWIDPDTFTDVLRGFHGRLLKAKDDNFLISPAVFDPNRGAGSQRSAGNIVYLRNLWLDFENGDLAPDELPKLFPRTRMVMMNSYHHTAAKPRFRVVIPTTQPVSPDIYEMLFDEVVAKLEDAGYAVDRRGHKKRACSQDMRKSGLDWSKRSATSLFYLPSQAEDPTQSIFAYYNDEDRKSLDPLPWIENSAIPLQPEEPHWSEPSDAKKAIDQAAVDAAIHDWRSTPKGDGNRSFFLLAVALRKAGMPPDQIEVTLERESSHARSPTDRNRQIRSIMKSLTENK